MVRLGTDFRGLTCRYLLCEPWASNTRTRFHQTPTRRARRSLRASIPRISFTTTPASPNPSLTKPTCTFPASPVNPPYSASGNHMGDEDPRALVDESLDYITSYKPLAIMMENVPTLETTHRTTLEKIKSRLHRDGYATKHTILNSKDFGVHQNRPRLYLVAVRKDKLKKDRKFLTLRVSPPAHPETTPRRVEVMREV